MCEPLSSQHQDHRTGVALALLAVLILSPDSLIVRAVETSDAGVLAWRGTLVAGAMLAVTAWRGSLVQRFRAGGRAAFAAGCCWALATVMFVFSVRRTDVASTLAIVGAGPLFAAVFERLALHAHVPLRTWLASLGVVGGLGWIFVAGADRGALAGDLAALAGSLAFAAFLTLLRRGRTIDMTPSLVIGGVVTACVALASGGATVPGARDAALLAALGLVILPVSLALTTTATRHLPAAEVSLLGRLEAVLGPLWVWLVLGDAPPGTVVAAGTVIVGATSAHWIAAMRAGSRGRRSPAEASPEIVDVDR
jgi:drug/metabolite transporter (DMT)-like permease